MMRFAAIALLVTGLAVPAWAQRGGGHGGGFAGHSSGAFRGGGFAAPHFSQGFTASRSYGYASDPRYMRPFTAYSNSRYRYPGYGSGFREPYRGSYGYDRLRRPGYYGAPYYGYAYLPYFPDWIGLGPLGCYPDVSIYNDDGGPDCDDQQLNAGPPAYQEYPPDGSPEYETPPPPADEPPSYTPQTPHPSQLPTNETATTIVFKDGRPSEQIHNYALTQTTLYVLDENHRDIPLDQLDLAATENVNRAVGVEFQIPQAVQ